MALMTTLSKCFGTSRSTRDIKISYYVYLGVETRGKCQKPNIWLFKYKSNICSINGMASKFYS